MSNYLAHIADRVLNRPLMVLPDKLSIIASVLAGRIGLDASGLSERPVVEGLDGPPTEASRFVGEFGREANGSRKPYRIANGVAIISVMGSLINRGSQLDAMSGVTSYEAIKHATVKASQDPDVKAILYDIDSPGGEAVGAFEVAEVIRAAGKKKPTATSVTGLCCSAAYAIASATQKIVVSTSSIAGSIGVVMMHADQSHRLHEAGVVPTLIYAGAHKVDGNPLEKLSDGVKAELKTEITRFYDLFVASVAKGRKGMSAEKIRATEARTYIGADAVAIGLADEVGSFESTLAALGGGGSRVPAASPTKKGSMMSTENQKAGVDAERDRIRAILGSEEARGREKAARHIAFTTTMTPDEAKALLATANRETQLDRGLDPHIGLALMPGQQSTNASAGWDKVVAECNERFIDPASVGRLN